MFLKKIKDSTDRKQCYVEERSIINGEVAIKPYYYMRNGLLHTRYTVDRCVELSKDEESRIKEEITACPQNKQIILAKYWNLLTVMVKKTIIFDGIRKGDERIAELKRKYSATRYKD